MSVKLAKQHFGQKVISILVIGCVRIADIAVLRSFNPKRAFRDSERLLFCVGLLCGEDGGDSFASASFCAARSLPNANGRASPVFQESSSVCVMNHGLNHKARRRRLR